MLSIKITKGGQFTPVTKDIMEAAFSRHRLDDDSEVLNHTSR